MPKWTDFGNIWTTLREVDVSVIRTEAERPITIACVGSTAAIDEIDRLLHTGADRYGPVGIDPVESVPLERITERTGTIRNANLLILGIDTRAPLAQHEADALRQLETMSVPGLLVLLHGASLPSDTGLPRAIAAKTVVIVDPLALDAPDKLATAALERLPAELHLSAARHLPGLRNIYVRNQINSSSFTNASYAIATGLPEQIPVLNVPFAVADIVVLTKNQAIMVYRMALAYGAPPEFQERIREVAPVIGGAFVWRQVARTAASLIPVWGFIPKVAIAYGGTYTTGVTAWRWFAYGEILSTEQIRKLSAEAMAIGRVRAKELVDRAKQLQPGRKDGQLPAPRELPSGTPPAKKPSLRERIIGLIPRRRKRTTPDS